MKELKTILFQGVTLDIARDNNENLAKAEIEIKLLRQEAVELKRRVNEASMIFQMQIEQEEAKREAPQECCPKESKAQA